MVGLHTDATDGHAMYMGRSPVVLERESARARISPGDRGNGAEMCYEESLGSETERETKESVYQELKTETKVNTFFVLKLHYQCKM